MVHSMLSPLRAFYKDNDCLEAALRLFHVHFNPQHCDPLLYAHATKTWVRNFEETSSVLKKKPLGGIKSVHTPENIAALRITVMQSPQRSAHQYALSLNLSSRSSVLHRDLNFHPYNV